MGLLGDIVGAGTDLMNFGLDASKFQYQKGLQQTMFKREDNAVQRRVEDLKAAGLSPTLAAGGGAQAGPVVNVSAPKLDGANLMRSVEYSSAKKQNAVTDAQLDLVNAQAKKADAEAFIPSLTVDVLRSDASGQGTMSRDLIRSELLKKIAENNAAVRQGEEVIRNTDLAREYGVASNSADAMDSITRARLMKQASKDGVFSSAAGALLMDVIGGITGRR